MYDPDCVGAFRAENLREIVHYIRRLFVRYYEEALLYWNLADEEGYFDGANEIYIYSEEALKKIVEDFS